jgi:hypothetical protein
MQVQEHRTNYQKRRIILVALKREEWSGLSNRELARVCSVSESLVRSIRRELGETSDKRA